MTVRLRGVFRGISSTSTTTHDTPPTGTLTVKFAQPPILLEASGRNTNTVIFCRAISAAVVDRDVDPRCPCIQRVLEQAANYPVQGGDDCRGLDLRNDVPGKRLYRHVVCKMDISLVR
jgi:hypothetical protein